MATTTRPMTSADNSVVDLPTTRIKAADIKIPRPTKTDRAFSKTIAQEIADSIKAKGLLYEPIVRDTGDGSKTPYETVCGIHRIYAMSQILKWEEIPVKIVKCDDDDARMLKLIENCARNSLSKDQFFAHVSEWKSLHEKKHKPGSAGGKAKAVAAAKKAAVVAGTEPTALVIAQAPNGDGEPTPSLASSPPAEAPAEPEPAQETDLLGMISGAMGGSKRSASRVIRISKVLDTFDPDERKIIFPDDPSKHATQGDLEGLAALPEELRPAAVKLVGSGMEWGRALKETAKKVVKLPDPTKPKSVDELTDAEWMDTCCATVRGRTKKVQPLTNDAILIREWMKLRKKLQSQVDEMLIRAKENGKKTGPAFRSLLQAFRMRHPNDWLGCADCGGTGLPSTPSKGDDKTYCKACMGAGYKVTTEPL